MKRIGYIHRFSELEQKGILVYGYNLSRDWNSPSPILFNQEQCRASVKTGNLVYFEIDENQVVSNIEPASIFNFDRDLMLSITSVFESKYWGECDLYYIIRYKNINELEDEGQYMDIVPKTTQNLSSLQSFDDSVDPDDSVSPDDLVDDEFFEEDAIDDEFEFDLSDFDGYSDSSIGTYKRITIPTSIEEEFALFGKSFPTTSSFFISSKESERQAICIDILDPRLWIPKISSKSENYYGKTDKECIDLFNILVSKRRKAHEFHLSRLRNDYIRTNGTFGLPWSHPELYLTNSVSSNWTYLLNNLSDKEIENVYTNYVLLQPVLPECFCENHIQLLRKGYGFPSVQIAEKFLLYKVRNVNSATDYTHCKKLLRSVINCGIKHLPDEGTPLCSIDRKKLVTLSQSLGRRRKEVINHVKSQIYNANPKLQDEAELRSYVDEQNITLLLQIGEFYDFIEQNLMPESEHLPFLSESLVKLYKKLPQPVCFLFDSYLQTIIRTKIISDLTNEKLSVIELDSMIVDCSKWINSSFLDDNVQLIISTFSKTSDLSELWNAYYYEYISEDIFILRLQDLIKDFTVPKLAQFITEPNEGNGYIRFADTPIKIHEYILNRIVELYGATNLENGESVRISEFNKFDNLADFIRWLTELKSGQYGPINQNAIEMAIAKAIRPLSRSEVNHLYDLEYLVKPGSKIKTVLDAYVDDLTTSMELQLYLDSTSNSD